MNKGKHNHRSIYTFMMIPNDENTVKTFKLPKGLIKGAIFILLTLFIISGYFISSFISMKVKYTQKSEDLDLLKVVNEKQKSQIHELKEYTSTIQEKMNGLDQLETEVKGLVGLPTPKEDKESMDTKEMKNEKAEEQASRGGLFSRKKDKEEEYDQGDTLEQIERDLENIDHHLVQEKDTLTDLKGDVVNQLDYLESLPNNWPNNGRLTSPFGIRTAPTRGASSFHKGVDIANSYGTSVLAAGKGKVIFAGWKSGYGRMVIISHGHGFSTVYAHNASITVDKNETVNKGQVIAKLGSSGISTGPHVHFEIHVNGSPVDPLKYLGK